MVAPMRSAFRTMWRERRERRTLLEGPCAQCDDQTPSMGSAIDAARDFHRAVHDFARVLWASIVR